jgi:hypothetical protein
MQLTDYNDTRTLNRHSKGKCMGACTAMRCLHVYYSVASTPAGSGRADTPVSAITCYGARATGVYAVRVQDAPLGLKNLIAPWAF